MSADVKALLAHVSALVPMGLDGRSPLTRHGWKDAITTIAGVEDFWRRHPNANVAVACGKPSGAWVFDVDVKNVDGRKTLADLEARHGALPLTWRTLTPSGGMHIWFRYTGRELPNKVNVRPGCDVRATGGLATCPPSRRVDGPYRWEVEPGTVALADAPAWLLAIIDPPPVARPPAPPIRAGSLDRLARYASSAILSECRELAGMTTGSGRNHQLFKAAARLGELVGADIVSAATVEEQLESAAADCGLLGEDGIHAVRATIKSGMARGVANPRAVAA